MVHFIKLFTNTILVTWLNNEVMSGITNGEGMLHYGMAAFIFHLKSTIFAVSYHISAHMSSKKIIGFL